MANLEKPKINVRPKTTEIPLSLFPHAKEDNNKRMNIELLMTTRGSGVGILLFYRKTLNSRNDRILTKFLYALNSRGHQ